jgi:hypothetical protein
VNLLRVVAGSYARVCGGDDLVVVGGEIAKSEVPVAEDIDPIESRDPIRMKPREAGDWM